MTEVPKHIGKYEVIDLLGHGGMGVVYRAVDSRIGRKVAIKTLTQGFSGDPEMLARFYDEARRTGRLSHPNIVIVYDLGDHDGVPYIVMECIEGEPLDRIIRSIPPPSMATSLRWVQEICSALAYAHRNNVIHRDVKPANIFIQSDGTAKLLDFGIARLQTRSTQDGYTQLGKIIGTVAYMAPERLRNDAIDGRSDIFSTGILLFQLLTGELPFKGEDLAVMHQLVNERHPHLSKFCTGYPSALDSILDRALAKHLDDRFSTADEMAFDLASVIAELAHVEVLQLFPAAQRLFAAEQFTEARAILQQVLRIDSKHAGAKSLLTEIQQNAIRRQREEKVQRIHVEAEAAIREKRLDDGIVLLEEALTLDSRNVEIAGLLDRTRAEKMRRDQVAVFLLEVQTARHRGDPIAALAAAQRALEIDKTNSQIIALYERLSQQAEEAETRSKVAKLISITRDQLVASRFTEAMKTLREVELLDSANPDLLLFRGEAREGIDRADREGLIQQLQSQVASAATTEQLQAVASSVARGLSSWPANATLLMLKDDLEQQINLHESVLFVDQTLKRCEALAPRVALSVIEEGKARFPNDQRILDLERSLKALIAKEELEQYRASLLKSARNAIQNERYAEAVSILQPSLTDGTFNSEIKKLSYWSLNMVAEQRRREDLRLQASQARAFIDIEQPDQAIALLKTSLLLEHDQTLRALLNEAYKARERVNRKVDALLNQANDLVRQERIDDALQNLRSQSPAISVLPQIRIALSILQDAKYREVFRLVGALYGNAETPSFLEEANSAVSKTLDQYFPSLRGAAADFHRDRRKRLFGAFFN